MTREVEDCLPIGRSVVHLPARLCAWLDEWRFYKRSFECSVIVEKYCSVYHLAINKPAALHTRIWHPAWLNVYLVYLMNIKSKLQYYYSTSFPWMLTFSFHCLNKGCLYMFTPGGAGSWILDMLEDHQYLAQFWWDGKVFHDTHFLPLLFSKQFVFQLLSKHCGNNYREQVKFSPKT